jgi:hypothetical protein
VLVDEDLDPGAAGPAIVDVGSPGAGGSLCWLERLMLALIIPSISTGMNLSTPEKKMESSARAEEAEKLPEERLKLLSTVFNVLLPLGLNRTAGQPKSNRACICGENVTLTRLLFMT